ncbi:plastocyanin/azurin family copper-binding protein [Rhodoferax sp. PAMC 29310]|uniref:cupredoxin domain-containing protein n=1 Tax=Rhodoferax sp. PAMC 29310 TaxID=2822760 RepID=UPI001F0A5800|nr:plastocyanin/azurin family copper-binding protein [Rhodoferax sp. PAMC 29310]
MIQSTFKSRRWRQAMGLGLALAGSALHAATLQVTVLDRDGKPAYDTVVIVVPAAGGVAKNPPPMMATVNQEKMQFVPAVTVVSPGAKVRFSNSDSWDHHVRLSEPVMTAGVAAGGAAEAFSLRLAGKTEGKPATWAEVTLDKPGEYGAALLSCLIHGSMSGHIYVADSPWTVKTDADGIATFNDLPDGAATVKVWHGSQLLSKPLLPVTLSATPARASVQLDVLMRRRRI